MTAAVQILPELQAAIAAAEAAAARLKTQLDLVISEARSEGLSAIPSSVRRLACERRQANAAREDRSRGDRSVLSAIPASVRHRQWRRRQAAAKKAAIDPSPHVVHGEARDRKHAEVRGTSDATGPLAATVAGILARTYGATNLRLRKAYQAIRTGVGIGSKGQIQLGEMWAKTASEKADARVLVEQFTIPQIKDVAVSVGETWKPNAKSPRVTVGLVLSRLLAARDGSPPMKRAYPRRKTGEQLDLRDRETARAAATTSRRKPVVDPPPRGPAVGGTETRTVPHFAASEAASDVSEAGKTSGEAVSPVSSPEQGSRGDKYDLSTAGPLQLAEPSSCSTSEHRRTLDFSPGVNGELQCASGGDHLVLQEPGLVPAPPVPPTAPLQIAEPSPATSAEARDVLDLVNATAARCRAFKTSPALRAKAAEARKGGPP